MRKLDGEYTEEHHDGHCEAMRLSLALTAEQAAPHVIPAICSRFRHKATPKRQAPLGERNALWGRQISPRGREILCGGREIISGGEILSLGGEIFSRLRV